MRTSLLVLVPAVLLAGLILGAFALRGFVPNQKPCVLGQCPLVIHENDSGRTFTYNVAARFEVFLEGDKNQKSDLQCTPLGVIEPRQYDSPVPPTYTASFEAVAVGTCVLSAKDFSATIVIQ